MIGTVRILQAVREDIPEILHLYSQPDIDNGQTLGLKDALVIYERFFQYPNYFLYVSKIEEKIIGTFALLIMDNLAHKGKPSAVVEDVVVDIGYRSQGIGRLMIEYAIDICKQYGCYKLALSSNIKRERAHRFYENLGFKKHGFSFLIEL